MGATLINDLATLQITYWHENRVRQAKFDSHVRLTYFCLLSAALVDITFKSGNYIIWT